MRKLLLIVLMASFFVGCGYELKPKGEVKKTTTVHILDVGSFVVDGDVEYLTNSRVEFTDSKGLEMVVHLSRCIVVTGEAKPTPAPQAKVPVPTPKPVVPPVKVPENKVDK